MRMFPFKHNFIHLFGPPFRLGLPLFQLTSNSTLDFVHRPDLLCAIFTHGGWNFIRVLRIRLKKGYLSCFTELLINSKSTYFRFLFNAHIYIPLRSVYFISLLELISYSMLSVQAVVSYFSSTFGMSLPKTLWSLLKCS